jgi:hypothetical protein
MENDMINQGLVLRASAAVLASFALSGCIFNGGGGLLVGNGALSDLGIRTELNAARADIVQLGATRNVSTTGTATYNGQAMLNLREVTTGAPISGEKRADVALTVNFAATTNPITGGLSNIRGTIDGQDFELDGETLPVVLSSITRIDLNPDNPDLPPGVGDILAGVPGVDQLTPGGISLTFNGTLSNGAAAMNMSGSFYGQHEDNQGETGIILDGGGTFAGGSLVSEGGMFLRRNPN